MSHITSVSPTQYQPGDALHTAGQVVVTCQLQLVAEHCESEQLTLSASHPSLTQSQNTQSLLDTQVLPKVEAESPTKNTRINNTENDARIVFMCRVVARAFTFIYKGSHDMAHCTRRITGFARSQADAAIQRPRNTKHEECRGSRCRGGGRSTTQTAWTTEGPAPRLCLRCRSRGRSTSNSTRWSYLGARMNAQGTADTWTR